MPTEEEVHEVRVPPTMWTATSEDMMNALLCCRCRCGGGSIAVDTAVGAIVDIPTSNVLKLKVQVNEEVSIIRSFQTSCRCKSVIENRAPCLVYASSRGNTVFWYNEG
jgi:hypothetical protein